MIKYQQFALLWVLICCLDAIGAEQPKEPRTYLVRIQQIAPVSETTISTNRVQNAVECQVTSGKEFYSYSIQNEEMILFRGALEEADNGKTIKLEYYYRRADAKGNPSGVMLAKGDATLKVSELRRVGGIAVGGGLSESVTNASAFAISVQDYRGFIGKRYLNSSFSVHLVDEAGKSISGAKAGLCDDDWVLYTGPVVSDEHGFVSGFDCREELPQYFFVAEHKERDLFAVVSLDRNQGDKPYVVVLKKGVPRPAGFEKERSSGWK